MMISVDLEILIELPSHKRSAQVITQNLREWSRKSDRTKLLILMKSRYQSTSKQELEQILVATGWEGRFQLEAWTPLHETRLNRKTNRELMLHHAKWHGAQAHIDVTTWPHEAQNPPIPLGLLLINNEWPLTRQERIITRIRKKTLQDRLEYYSAIAINNNSRAAALIDKENVNQSKPEELISALESCDIRTEKKKPTLAWVSPMPPQKTGVAGYSSLLVYELSKHYDLTVVTDAPSEPRRGKTRNITTRRTSWLKRNARSFDRICYHLGNSPFHQSILDCMEQWPGAVVLHETSLGDLIYSYESGLPGTNKKWLSLLYKCYGYRPLCDALKEQPVPFSTIQSYACSETIVERALGTITHSGFASKKVAEYTGLNNSALNCRVPMCTKKRHLLPREKARQILGVDKDTFLICSFGMVGKAKLSMDILEAWVQLESSPGMRSELVFVGENEAGAYGHDLRHQLEQESMNGRCLITGWVDNLTYEMYLSAADLAIQFRTINRGETSAAIYDVVCAGVPTIINQNAGMSDLEASHVMITSEYPQVAEIADAIRRATAETETIRRDRDSNLHQLQKEHGPENCAIKYRDSLEEIYNGNKALRNRVLDTVAQSVRHRRVSLDEALGLLNKSFSVKEKRLKQLFIDVSQIARSDYKTGIQRVVRSLVLQFIECGIEDYRVEPVWLVSSPGGWHYRYARHWTTRMIGYQEDLLDDACIDPDKDDILLVADLTGGYFVEAERYGVYEQLEKKGVVLAGIVYDILPIQMPHCFPPGTKDTHEHWLQSISARARTLICISKAVADETIEWLSRNQLSKPADQTVTWFHLGADLENSAPSAGFPSEMQTLENTLANNISFLMVGTIEPRKGHQQALEAFQLLHDDNHNVCLIIVGKKGWMVDSLSGQITRAEESDKRIYWFENASDEFLEWLYQHCDCLLAASEGEGFGLPLIEAALHGLPLLARDIPVFREVAGNAAEYFTAKDAADLAGAILSWRNLKEEERHPQSSGLDYINWEQSAKQLIQALGLRTTR